jgi:hypothetical protein
MDCAHLRKSGLCDVHFDPGGFGFEACVECSVPPDKRDKCQTFKPRTPETEKERAIAFSQVEEGGGL